MSTRSLPMPFFLYSSMKCRAFFTMLSVSKERLRREREKKKKGRPKEKIFSDQNALTTATTRVWLWRLYMYVCMCECVCVCATKSYLYLPPLLQQTNKQTNISLHTIFVAHSPRIDLSGDTARNQLQNLQSKVHKLFCENMCMCVHVC